MDDLPLVKQQDSKQLNENMKTSETFVWKIKWDNFSCVPKTTNNINIMILWWYWRRRHTFQYFLIYSCCDDNFLPSYQRSVSVIPKQFYCKRKPNSFCTLTMEQTVYGDNEHLLANFCGVVVKSCKVSSHRRSVNYIVQYNIYETWSG